MADAHKNFASSLVATAPSPATSGTSLVVTTGDGTKFPTAPFNATIWPASSNPTTANAEIVRVTAVSTDTLTIVRAQEGTSARTVVVGDQIVAGITAKTVTDAEVPSSYLAPTGFSYETMNRGHAGDVVALTSGTLYLTALSLPAGFPIGKLSFFSANTVGTPTHRWYGLFDASRVMLACTADATNAAWSANTISTLNIATIASGAGSSFTTTYSGLHYIGIMVTASTMPQIACKQGSSQLNAVAPVQCGGSNTAQTTPPAFAFTANALTALSLYFYANVGT